MKMIMIGTAALVTSAILSGPATAACIKWEAPQAIAFSHPGNIWRTSRFVLDRGPPPMSGNATQFQGYATRGANQRGSVSGTLTRTTFTARVRWNRGDVWTYTVPIHQRRTTLSNRLVQGVLASGHMRSSDNSQSSMIRTRATLRCMQRF